MTGATRSTPPAALTVAVLLALAGSAQAYVGPGAGFALVTSFLVVFAAIFLALFYLFSWPVRLLWRLLRGRRVWARARVRRLVVLGLDGLDAGLCARLLKEGQLPNLARLRFKALGTTTPAMSPVAWSTFQTGMDPSYHAIFDFIRPARPGYGGELSSVAMAPPRRVLRLGRLRLPLSKPTVRLRRKGEPFWRILGRHGVFSSIIRVPITFPPEKFNGLSLSAMCVPDLRGTQGTFTLFTSEVESDQTVGEEDEGGVRVPVSLAGGTVVAALTGPPDPLVAGNPVLRIPFKVRLDGEGGGARLEIGGRSHRLEPRRHTDWIPVTFRSGFLVGIRGLVRFNLVSTAPHFNLYASPVQLDPERPAMPISHPPSFSVYLARRFGPFATLGLAEDTWALNERAYGEEDFLEGTWRIHAERETMFFDALDKVRRGLVTCVFDASDRIQHMFTGTMIDDHPASRYRDPGDYAGVVEDMYRRMDDLVGRTRERLAPGDELLVISDHGFTQFKRGVNLNAWLLERGWLRLREGEDGTGSWFDGVDWERTRAFALGLAGIYINRRDRYSQGCVAPEELAPLKAEIGAALLQLRDPEGEQAAIRSVADPEALYAGPYRDEAPDIMVGFAAGYRVSWDGARGVSAGEIFQDNVKAWSGDHCVDPALVPGVIFSTLPLAEGPARIVDLAPSILDLFGVNAPARMKGRRLFEEAGA